MMNLSVVKDLVVLAADKNMEFTVKGLLNRPKRLSIRPVKFDVFVHPERDAGSLRKCDDFLRIHIKRFSFSLVMFDREGCGREQLSREELEALVEDKLSSSGWADRAAAVVIDPELENWVWSNSPNVDGALGWQGVQPNLRTWLLDQNYLEEGQAKPGRPKEAMQAALRSMRKPPSSSIFKQIAESVSLKRCNDPSFLKLKKTLQNWFPR